MRVSLKKEILEEIVGYMSTKPYREVAKFIAEIQIDIKEIPEVVERSKPTEKE